jgi:hypothetical protein
MVTLLAASRIHSKPAANHSAGQKIRRSASPARGGAVAHGTNDGLHQQSSDRPGQPQQRQTGLISTEVLIDRTHIALLQAKTELNAKETDIHVDDLPERQVRFFHQEVLSW